MATTTTRDLETRAILASRYIRGATPANVARTHVLDLEANAFLCGRIDAVGAADRHAEDVNAPATCPTCAGRDPRHPRPARRRAR